MYKFISLAPPPHRTDPGAEPDRILVWRETKERYKNFPTWPSQKFTEMPPAPEGQGPAPEGQGPAPRAQGSQAKSRPYQSTLVRVIKRDMIDEAVDLKAAGANPLVLNMADWQVAGGCVEAGSGAQEEECFRRSNYFRTLLQSFYPLGKLDTIVSKGVEYYRRGAEVNYIYMQPQGTTVKLDMIAQPALRFPQMTRDNKYFADDGEAAVFEEKIHMLLRVAALHGADTLILSAWGCGAFGCPAHHVAKMFKKVLTDYNGVFKEVVFAIIGPNYEKFANAWNE